MFRMVEHQFLGYDTFRRAMIVRPIVISASIIKLKSWDTKCIEHVNPMI